MSITNKFKGRIKQTGFSLMELMIAIAIGLILLAALTMMFVRSTESYTDIQNSAQQIENGRYATDVISQDLRLAGYYGDFSNVGMWWPVTAAATAPTALPDPCDLSAAALTTSPYTQLIFPVQGYDAADASTRADIATPTVCDSVSASVPNPINNANLVAGTDVLVIRRADTSTVASPASNDIFIQSSVREIAVQFGNPAGFAVGALDAANNVTVIGTSAGGATAGSAVVNPAVILKVSNKVGASPGNYATRLAADVRKYHIHIYFIAPCSRPTGGGLSCTGASDDGGAPVPTLKRLELTSVGGVTQMSLVPLVEGIENLQVEYGIDDAPATANANTGLLGDGVPDTYKIASAATLADWSNVVTARIYLLARNVLPTTGYTDTKQYELGPLGLTLTPGGNFKRHLYSTEVRLVNPSARREVP